MEFITAEEASKRWNIGLRSVQRMCAAGRIEGAEKRSNIWMIPDSASPQRDKKQKTVFLKMILLKLIKTLCFKNSINMVTFLIKISYVSPRPQGLTILQLNLISVIRILRKWQSTGRNAKGIWKKQK